LRRKAIKRENKREEAISEEKYSCWSGQKGKSSPIESSGG
jgi:hypothetical protein